MKREIGTANEFPPSLDQIINFKNRELLTIDHSPLTGKLPTYPKRINHLPAYFRI
jgi:hypothetical protein